MRMLSPIVTEFSWPKRRYSSEVTGMDDVFADFDRIVNALAAPTLATTVGFQPSCDINETKEHYMVSFDMPGVKKDEIKIEIRGNELVISGERHKELKKDSSRSALRNERTYGKFERTFVLPNSINVEKIEAQYEDGVLNVALPKLEAAKGRKIEIQSGQSGFFSKLLSSRKESANELKDVKVS